MVCKICLLRGGPLEITGGGGGGGGKNFSVDEFFFSPICLHVFFFSTWKLCTNFFFHRTSFNIKGTQSSAQFNYSTAQGDSLFGVLIFAKFEYGDYRERNELL